MFADFCWVWCHPQLLQKRWCAISAERRSPQRMLWRPTGKHTQVFTRTNSPLHPERECLKLLSKPWLRHSCDRGSKLACHAGWVKLFLSWCSIIYQQGGGRPLTYHPLISPGILTHRSLGRAAQCSVTVSDILSSPSFLIMALKLLPWHPYAFKNDW